jgi:hypothetical protein
MFSGHSSLNYTMPNTLGLIKKSSLRYHGNAHDVIKKKPTVYVSTHPRHRRPLHMGHHMVAAQTGDLWAVQATRGVLPKHCRGGIEPNQ